MTWDEVTSAISEKRRSLTDEAETLEQQLKTLEEQVKIQDSHVESLKARLTALEDTGGPETKPDAVAEGQVAAAEAPSNDRLREKELIDSSANRMLLVEGKAGEPIGAFLAPQDSQIRVFLSAQWLGQNPAPKVSKLDRSSLPIRQELACPVGVEVVCLHTDALDLPHFELANATEKPVVGARVVVIFPDLDTKQAKGIGGSIRGIGPDTLELDAELTPKMTGAPVLSLDSGKVIGVVAPQVAGVKDEWAIGTRHQGSRNFATRMDRIQEWKSSDLGRFAKEAAYIREINQRTRIAWLAHMLLVNQMNFNYYARAHLSVTNSKRTQTQKKAGETTQEYLERTKREQEQLMEENTERAKFLREVKEETRKHATNPHIARANSWLDEPSNKAGEAPGDDVRIRLSNIYRAILADLSKQEPDLSEHMTPYHFQQFRIAKANRAEGIHIIAQNANRVGQ